MKLSISNIAWEQKEEAAVAGLLAERGLQGVELAPTKMWTNPTTADDTSISACQSFWHERNISIVAFQALLFGRPELTLFSDEATRARTCDYLAQIIALAARLGAGVLVFGSPKNRIRGEMALHKAMDLAIEFFSELAEIAWQHKVQFCIEPNPPEYGCDFICTAAEACELVRQVNHPGFRLHLDSGVMTLNQESYEQAIEQGFEWLAHFHISEPQLAIPGSGRTDHAHIATRLRQLDYQGWVSIEMRNGWKSPDILAVEEALNFVIPHYSPAIRHYERHTGQF